MRTKALALTFLLSVLGRAAGAQSQSIMGEKVTADGPQYVLDLALSHPGWLLVAVTLLLLIWLVVPIWAARSLAPDTPDPQKRECAVDRIRGLLTKMIAFPLVVIPLLAYVDGYLKERDIARKEAQTRFEERYRESAQLISSREPISQLLGLRGIDRLLSENPDKKDPVLQALAMSASLWSPVKDCSEPTTLITAVGQALLETVAMNRHHDLELSLGGACLRGAKIPYANLNGSDLSYSNLSGADLYRASLYQANLRFTNLSAASLSGADLSHAGLYCTRGDAGKNHAVASLMDNENVPLQLEAAKLHKATITRTLMPNAKLAGVLAYDTTIKDSCFAGADLYQAEFRHATIEDVDFSHVEASGVNFNRNRSRGCRACQCRGRGGRSREAEQSRGELR